MTNKSRLIINLILVSSCIFHIPFANANEAKHRCDDKLLANDKVTPPVQVSRDSGISLSTQIMNFLARFLGPSTSIISAHSTITQETVPNVSIQSNETSPVLQEPIDLPHPNSLLTPQQRVKAAADRFGKFFNLLTHRHVGYDAPLFGLAQAGLAKLPVLVMGSGGNGKSFFSGILSLIANEESTSNGLLSRNFGPDTSKADIVGPLNPGALINREEYVRIQKASMTNYYGVRVEEFFDASPTVVRAFHEAYDDKEKRTLMFVGTTNKTIDQIMVTAEDNYGDRDLPRPTLNRFPIKIIVPRDFNFANQYLHMFYGVIESQSSPADIQLSWQDILALSQLTKTVEIPLYVDVFLISISLQLKGPFIQREVNELEDYKKNKRLKGDPGSPPFVSHTFISKRAIMQARELIRSNVVVRELKILSTSDEKVKLTAKTSDLANGVGLIPIVATELEFLDRLIAEEPDPNERLQLSRASDQILAFRQSYQETLRAANEEYLRLALGNAQNEQIVTDETLLLAINNNPLLLNELTDLLKDDLEKSSFNGDTVGRVQFAEQIIAIFTNGRANEFLKPEVRELFNVLKAFKSPLAKSNVDENKLEN